jgi:hypothetical protein
MLGRSLAVTGSEQATERETLRWRDRPRHVERGPAVPSPDIGTPATALEEMEVKEGPPPGVEDAGRFLDDARPRADLGEHAGEIVEELWRAVGHEILSCLAARATSGAPGAFGA